MSAKVSILVPFYNVAPFFERCIRSLFEQTFSDIEYVFVNDASPDNSEEILLQLLEEYPHRKIQTKVIRHKENRGLAAARMTASDASNGDYVLCVDSDDYVELDMVEQMYAKAITENADIVVSDIYIECRHQTIYEPDYVWQTPELRLYNVLFGNSFAYCFNKLIKREVYQMTDCKIPEGLDYLEDRYLICRMLFYANKVVKLDKAFYHYNRLNESSITRVKTRKHFLNLILFWEKTEEFLDKNGLLQRYQKDISESKAIGRMRIMADTHHSAVRKEFADVYLAEEKANRINSELGEKILLWLVRRKLFFFAQSYHNFSLLKHGRWREISW